jgi:hypothetical protein
MSRACAKETKPTVKEPVPSNETEILTLSFDGIWDSRAGLVKFREEISAVYAELPISDAGVDNDLIRAHITYLLPLLDKALDADNDDDDDELRRVVKLLEIEMLKPVLSQIQ